MGHDHDHSHLWPGVPFALASALLFGLTPVVSKVLLKDTDPFLLAGLLYLGAGLGLALYRLLTAKAVKEAPLGSGDMPWLAGAILMGGIIGPVLLMLGLLQTPASSASLLLNLEGLATMAIAWLVYRENVDGKLLAGALAILAGAVVISWTGAGVSLDSGALFVAGACLAWGMDNNLTRKISGADPVTIALSKGLVAGTVNLAIGLWTGAQVPPMMTISFAAVTGFFGIGVSLTLFILALRHLGTARAGAYYSVAPFMGAVISILFLDEALTTQIILAAVLMAIGLWLHLSERHEHEHEHDIVEHEHTHVHDEHHQHVHDGKVTEPHTHVHKHERLKHAHRHYPDLHHRHGH